MTKSVNLQHRHFVLIAETIASLRDYPGMTHDAHIVITDAFAKALRNTNPRFDDVRFIACAMGNPVSGRDA